MLIFRLPLDYQIKEFDCGDSDLNEFLVNDSINHQKDLLTVTYIIEYDDGTMTKSFFSLLNDKISITDINSNRSWKNKIQSVFGGRKNYRSYPSVKIGRLAICKKSQRQGFGKILLDYIKIWFIEQNKTGCRFLTVDAYRDSISFYEKNGFQFLSEQDKESDTRLMFFDLGTLSL